VSSKIGGIDGNSNPTAAVGAGRAVQRPQDTTTGAPQSDESNGNAGNGNVQITGAARQLATLEQAVRDLPVVNDARVAQLSNAIEQGTYSVNSHHVADQLMQMEKALGRIPDGSDADPNAEAD
jgi:negative regulator of flagellin synthesis FlgM